MAKANYVRIYAVHIYVGAAIVAARMSFTTCVLCLIYVYVLRNATYS